MAYSKISQWEIYKDVDNKPLTFYWRVCVRHFSTVRPLFSATSRNGRNSVVIEIKTIDLNGSCGERKCAISRGPRANRKVLDGIVLTMKNRILLLKWARGRVDCLGSLEKAIHIFSRLVLLVSFFLYKNKNLRVGERERKRIKLMSSINYLTYWWGPRHFRDPDFHLAGRNKAKPLFIFIKSPSTF